MASYVRIIVNDETILKEAAVVCFMVGSQYLSGKTGISLYSRDSNLGLPTFSGSDNHSNRNVLLE